MFELPDGITYLLHYYLCQLAYHITATQKHLLCLIGAFRNLSHLRRPLFIFRMTSVSMFRNHISPQTLLCVWPLCTALNLAETLR
jgi:hypothetical protein